MYLKCGISCVRWVVFFGFFIPTFELKLCNGECGNMTVVTGLLDSTVMLPCSFDNSTINPVLWSKKDEDSIIRISGLNRVDFLNNKMGRVIVFPNLSQRGNFSLRIDRFQAPDVGVYCCERGNQCRGVEVKQGQRNTAKPIETEKTVKDLPIGIYIIIAATVILIALILACGYMLKNKWICVNRVEYNINHTDNKVNTTASTQPSAPSHPHEQQVTPNNTPQDRGDSNENSLRELTWSELPPAKQNKNKPHQVVGDVIIPHRGFSYFNNDMQRGGIMGNGLILQHRQPITKINFELIFCYFLFCLAVHRPDSVVYENNEHDPEHQRVETSLKTNFERDIRSSPRNRISHVAQPNYANQSEINKADKSVKEAQKIGRRSEIRNPIYGNSTECLMQDE
ncbi:uncharacterized protein LOC125308611 isoform X2 [Alosa alosa]|uniref:uncharacterized protein LOC125308611 isoform X2 n=1 Tax=Alosa alosa TaxID=278164 RepID=UPI0020151126|nr:uncharacterized protein LOC125308611 isoform X2 [Alosa alosa]